MATTALVRNGTAATARPSSSRTTAASRADAPAPPRSSGTSRPARPTSAASACHSAAVVRRVRVQRADLRGRVEAVPQQVAHRGPQVLLDLAVEQVGVPERIGGDSRVERLREVRVGRHRGRSFHGTVVSVRGSAGRPSTRSAITFRRISDVPPSIELPFARRYR